MAAIASRSCYIYSLVFTLSIASFLNSGVSVDYKAALSKSLLYFEAQRSGKLPPDQRIKWRADSALNDGKDVGVDLSGGYYDAGDGVKFGFPMAFTVTMLAWSAVDFRNDLEARNELGNALKAIKWGTDYFIKAHRQPEVLYGQVGDGNTDHACWQRPEEMTMNRPSFKIDSQHPGSDLAGETAAAFAAASIAFSKSKPDYASTLLNHAKQLFDFATKYTGKYQNSISNAGQFYSSSDFQDELLWAAAWLERATNDKKYTDFITKSSNSGGTRTQFSWDDKYVGAQVLIAKRIMEGKASSDGNMGQFRNNAEQFICNAIQKGSSNIQRTNGGLLWTQEWNNLQYVTSAAFILTVYADILLPAKKTLQCPAGNVNPNDIMSFARSQVDYILGSNPKKYSYMVGFGQNFPKRVHHRGASIPSIKEYKTPVTCQGGFDQWLHKNADNPNVLEGAVVGGPNKNDEYSDSRENYQQSETGTANNAPLVGVLARFSAMKKSTTTYDNDTIPNFFLKEGDVAMESTNWDDDGDADEREDEYDEHAEALKTLQQLMGLQG